MKYVYVIQFGEQNIVKIGVADNMRERLRDLQIGCPIRLRIYDRFKVPDELAFKYESMVHARLRTCQLSGEWFEVPPYEACAVVVAVISGAPPKTEVWAERFKAKVALKYRMLRCPFCNHKAESRLTNKQIWAKRFRCTSCNNSFPGKRFFIRRVA